MADVSNAEARALILTRGARDADIAAALLAEAGIESAPCDDVQRLVSLLEEGAALVIATEGALATSDLKGVSRWLERQEPWSDLPFILLTQRSQGLERNPPALRLMKVLGNVSFLERPFHPTTFVSLVQAAQRARQRQYLARDHLAERERSAAAIRQSAERLEFAQRAARLGAWELALDTRTLTASAIFKANFGRPASETFTYEDMRASVHRDDIARFDEVVEAAAAGAEDYDIEYRNVWPDGSIHWVQVRGRSTDVDGQPRMVGISMDITNRKEIEQRQWLLTAELDHRVKNLLAVIQSLVAQTRQGATDLDKFATNLDGRLQAIARTNNLLSRSRWQGANLAEIIRDEMQAFTGQDPERVSLAGGDLLVRPKAATALGMAVHELATNAAKYGALSTPGGSVSIEWRREPGPKQGDLMLRWQERGGPPVGTPKRRGFGSTLIERVLAFEVDGHATQDFAREGLVCTIAIPQEQILPLPDRHDEAGPVPARPARRGVPSSRRRRILVVEDSALVAMDVESVVTDLGWEVVGPASRLKQARDLAESETLDGAILDVDLDGSPVFPVAEILQRRGVPFIFATGYDAVSVLPPKFHKVPTVQKPFDTASLVSAIRSVVADAKPSRQKGRSANRASGEAEVSEPASAAPADRSGRR